MDRNSLVFLVLLVLFVFGSLLGSITLIAYDQSKAQDKWKNQIARIQAEVVAKGSEYRTLAPAYFKCRAGHTEDDLWIAECLGEMRQVAEAVEMTEQYEAVRDDILKLEPLSSVVRPVTEAQ